MENQKLKGIYIDVNMMPRFIEYYPEPPLAENFGADYDQWVKHEMALSQAKNTSLHFFNIEEVRRAVVMAKLKSMQQANVSWDASLKPDHIYPVPHGFQVEVVPAEESMCISEPLVRLKKIHVEPTFDERLEMERSLLHMKIELMGSRLQAELNENLQILNERFRLSPDYEPLREWISSRYCLTHFMAVSGVADVTKFLRLFPGVIEAYPSLLHQTNSPYKFYVTVRRYKHFFLVRDVADKIQTWLRELLPARTSLTVEITQKLPDPELLILIK